MKSGTHFANNHGIGCEMLIVCVEELAFPLAEAK